MSATAVRTHDMSVRSRLKRVRIHAEWLSKVDLTSSPCGCLAWSAISDPFPDRSGWTAAPLRWLDRWREPAIRPSFTVWPTLPPHGPGAGRAHVDVRTYRPAASRTDRAWSA